MRRARQMASWLLVMDALAWLGLFGSRAYLFCVARASDCEDWGPPLDPFNEERDGW